LHCNAWPLVQIMMRREAQIIAVVILVAVAMAVVIAVVLLIVRKQ
jgi:hypothetical protein